MIRYTASNHPPATGRHDRKSGHGSRRLVSTLWSVRFVVSFVGKSDSTPESAVAKTGMPHAMGKNIVITDEPVRAAASVTNFLWTTFTRFEPAADIHAAERRIVRRRSRELCCLAHYASPVLGANLGAVPPRPERLYLFDSRLESFL